MGHGFGLEDSIPGLSIPLWVAIPTMLVLILHIRIGHVRVRERQEVWSWFIMRNNQQEHIQISSFIMISVRSYIFGPPTMAFKTHLPEDGYNSWPKPLGGYALYNVINIRICICIFLLFLIKYFWNIIVVRCKLWVYINYMICQRQLVV